MALENRSREQNVVRIFVQRRRTRTKKHERGSNRRRARQQGEEEPQQMPRIAAEAHEGQKGKSPDRSNRSLPSVTRPSLRSSNVHTRQDCSITVPSPFHHRSITPTTKPKQWKWWTRHRHRLYRVPCAQQQRHTQICVCYLGRLHELHGEVHERSPVSRALVVTPNRHGLSSSGSLINTAIRIVSYHIKGVGTTKSQTHARCAMNDTRLRTYGVQIYPRCGGLGPTLLELRKQSVPVHRWYDNDTQDTVVSTPKHTSSVELSASDGIRAIT